MAGRYLVVEVEDSARAEVLRANLDKLDGVRVVGLFAYPTLFCECKSSANSVLSSRYRWRICPECKRPRANSHQQPLNLLPEHDHTAELLDRVQLSALEGHPRVKSVSYSMSPHMIAKAQQRATKRRDRKGKRR